MTHILNKNGSSNALDKVHITIIAPRNRCVSISFRTSANIRLMAASFV